MVEEYLNSKSENYKGENLKDNIIFYLGVCCGFRKSEIINLKWEDIDFN
jgi:integrase